MGHLTIAVFCPTCGKQIEAEYVGKYRELLRKILERAGHQPGDKVLRGDNGENKLSGRMKFHRHCFAKLQEGRVIDSPIRQSTTTAIRWIKLGLFVVSR